MGAALRCAAFCFFRHVFTPKINAGWFRPRKTMRVRPSGCMGLFKWPHALFAAVLAFALSGSIVYNILDVHQQRKFERKYR